jgi:hypothetical protein
VAHAFDIAKQDTPRPDEFADAESDVMEAAALVAVSPALGMIEYQHATSRYADLVAKAEETAKHDIPDTPLPPDVGPQLGPGVKLAAETPLTTARSQIEAKFKHAQDFGVTEPRGLARFDAFEKAVAEQVKDPATMHIAARTEVTQPPSTTILQPVRSSYRARPVNSFRGGAFRRRKRPIS